MNLPCLIGMIVCTPLSPMPDKRLPSIPHNELTPSGSELLREIIHLDVKERETMILEWLRKGYLPKQKSLLKPVQVKEGGHHLVYWVMADYLRLGSDENSVLLPLAYTSVRTLAKEWGLLLPTAKMVDQIYQQSERIHWPHAYPPSDEMRSTEFFLKHSAWIDERSGFNFHESPLLSGHKKDLVVSSRLLARPKKLALYGWHNLGNGVAIQPQSLWHGEYYVDYSHGIRFISPRVELDGKDVSLASVLRDPELSRLVSFEGAFDICEVLRYPCEGESEASTTDGGQISERLK